MSDRLPSIPPPPPPPPVAVTTSARPSHLAAALSAVAGLLPAMVEAANPQLLLKTQKGSSHLVKQLGTTAKLAGNSGAVQSTQTGKFIGQLRFDQVQQAGKLAAGSTMVFQLAGAAAMQQTLDQIAASLERVENKVDRVLWNQQQGLLDETRAQEDLLAQLITSLRAGRKADTVSISQLRAIESQLTTTAHKLVSQVEKDLASVGTIGQGLTDLVAKAGQAPTAESAEGRMERAKSLAKLSAKVTADLAVRSVSTVRTRDLRKELTDVNDSVTRTEELLIVALRAISTRAIAGLLASQFDESQPQAARVAEADAIRAWLADIRQRLVDATNLSWLHDVDDEVLSRLFVGHSKKEAAVKDLSPLLLRLDRNVESATDALSALGRTDVIDFEVVEVGTALPPPS